MDRRAGGGGLARFSRPRQAVRRAPSVGQYAHSIRDPANDWGPVAGTARCGRYRLNAMSLGLSPTAVADDRDDNDNDSGDRYRRGDRRRHHRRRRHRWRQPATLQPLLLLLSAAGCLCNPDAKRLYDDLLSNYNRLIRPVSNNNDTVLVKLGLRLSQLIELVRHASPPPLFPRSAFGPDPKRTRRWHSVTEDILFLSRRLLRHRLGVTSFPTIVSGYAIRDVWQLYLCTRSVQSVGHEST